VLVMAAVAATSLPLAIASCSDAGQAVATAAPCDSPGVTPTQIKVGFIYPDTGLIAPALRNARAGVEARIGLANALGGVHGRKIDLEWRDDTGDTQTFAADVQDLVTRQGAFGLIADTLNITGSADELDRQGVPVSGLPAEAAWTQHRNMFTLGAFLSDDAYVTTFGSYVRRLGGTRAVLITDTASQSTGELTQTLADSLRSQNVTVVDTINYNAKITSPEAVAQKVRASRADTLLGPLAPDAFVAVYNAVRKAGVPLKVALNGSGYDPQYLAEYGTEMAGISFFVGYTPFSVQSPSLQDYQHAMAAYSPESTAVDNDVTLSAYVTADEFVRGLDLAGACPTRKAFIDNLRAVRSYNAGGLIPSIDLSQYSEPNVCYAFVRVNETGTAFDVMQNTGAPNPVEWCGTRQARR
jgi:ABC-type branched-subunit amino acid transport system substrate-binding protein